VFVHYARTTEHTLWAIFQDSLIDWYQNSQRSHLFMHHCVAAWLSSCALSSINKVTVCHSQLVLGWVTIFGQVNHRCL